MITDLKTTLNRDIMKGRIYMAPQVDIISYDDLLMLDVSAPKSDGTKSFDDEDNVGAKDGSFGWFVQDEE